MRNRLFPVVIAIMAVVFLAIVLAGCGNDTANPPASNGGGQFTDASQSTCFTEMSPQQKAQLQQYASSQGGSLGQTSNNTDGTQDICVLEKAPDGSYNQRYYKKDDGFSDYLLYSAMLGHTNALLAYSALQMDPNSDDALMLMLLTGVNSDGMMYHPYSYQGGRMLRSPVVMNTNVTNVYYGRSTTPTRYSANLKPPSGYRTQPLPPPSDKTATLAKNGTVQSTGTGGLSLVKSQTGAAAGSAKVPAAGTGVGSGPRVNQPAPAAPRPAPAAPPRPAAPPARSGK